MQLQAQKNCNYGLAGAAVVPQVHKIKPNLNRIVVYLNTLIVYLWKHTFDSPGIQFVHAKSIRTGPENNCRKNWSASFKASKGRATVLLSYLLIVAGDDLSVLMEISLIKKVSFKSFWIKIMEDIIRQHKRNNLKVMGT